MRLPLCLLMLAAGCAPSDAPGPAPPGPTTAGGVEEAPAEPNLNAALREALLGIYGPDSGEVRYFWGEVDLDGDGQPEAVAHVVGPLVCGSGGCNTLVFTPGGGGLWRVAGVSVSRPPVIAAQTETNGWRDLAVGGGGAEGGRALLPFDGASYPSNPTVEPAQPADGAVDGTVVIEPFDSFADGELLREGG
ncbi:hypothetical protein RQM47_10335 [Rubrivirga sp. S365]|uniref:Lipoprotein n=1 Tax=Rubrivirga litoralis TaxID=3075598 RepID=A0ABU3BS76_9BACT|nr:MULTISPECIES: hypothetical protein [unclassified Rubrivirga]MDT0632146.1 hypothetical protein [Rubrivirga sp. F394]MDT7857038.1 hypothetical protein [Rubrivirga sp. S365]